MAKMCPMREIEIEKPSISRRGQNRSIINGRREEEKKKMIMTMINESLVIITPFFISFSWSMPLSFGSSENYKNGMSMRLYRWLLPIILRARVPAKT